MFYYIYGGGKYLVRDVPSHAHVQDARDILPVPGGGESRRLQADVTVETNTVSTFRWWIYAVWWNSSIDWVFKRCWYHEGIDWQEYGNNSGFFSEAAVSWLGMWWSSTNRSIDIWFGVADRRQQIEMAWERRICNTSAARWSRMGSSTWTPWYRIISGIGLMLYWFSWRIIGILWVFIIMKMKELFDLHEGEKNGRIDLCLVWKVRDRSSWY